MFGLAIIYLILFWISWIPFAVIINLIAKLDWRFWILLKEGEAAVIVQNGEVTKLVLALDGHRYAGDRPFPDRDDVELAAREWEIIPYARGLLKKLMRKIRFIFFLGGVRWIGLAGTPLQYMFEWLSPGAIIAGMGLTFQHHEEPLKRIRVNPVVYGFDLINVEFAGVTAATAGVTTAATGTLGKIQYIVSGQITNPFIALVRRAHWLRDLQEVLEPRMSLLLGSFTFEQLTGTDPVAKANLDTELTKLLTENREVIKKSFGFRIDRIQTGSPDPMDDQQREVTQRARGASAEADVKRIEAKGQADAINLVGTATANAAQSLRTALGGDPAIVAAVQIAQARRDGLVGFKGSTLVEGSAGQVPGLILNTGAPTTPPATPSPPAVPPTTTSTP